MKITRILSTLAAAALAAMSNTTTAAPGDLDLTFGGTGKVTTVVSDSFDSGKSVAIQGDGKIVVAGTVGNDTGFALVRYNSGGSVDTSLNGTGRVITTVGGDASSAYGVVIQLDGTILVSGTATTGNADFAMVRYTTSGTLDGAFGSGGKVTTPIGFGDDYGYRMAVQADGKILVVGSAANPTYHDFALVRYTADGLLDTSFNGTGKVTTDIGSTDDYGQNVAIQNDGKIVVVGFSRTTSPTGYLFAAARYNTNGSLDMSFNGTGKVTTQVAGTDNRAYGVVIQSDQKIVVAGSAGIGSSQDFALVRYNTNGSLDTSFSGDGKLTTDVSGIGDSGQSVALQGDGKIVVAGTASIGTGQLFALVRYNTNGSLDTSFSGDGKVTTNFSGAATVNGMAIQSDGKIVVAGSATIGLNPHFALARYEGDSDSDGDGVADIYETGTGIYVSPTDTGTSPTNPDTDGDGLTDGQEVNTYHSNPNIPDTDGDGFNDGFEVSTGFSPTSAASTPDALSSIRTAAEYRFNAALGISYRIEASTDLANWSTIETNIIGAGGVITRFYSIEGQPKRYFRSRRN